jgi:hypothetical protein
MYLGVAVVVKSRALALLCVAVAAQVVQWFSLSLRHPDKGTMAWYGVVSTKLVQYGIVQKTVRIRTMDA